jgi:SsrA-binding protein
MAAKKDDKEKNDSGVIASNRKAFHDYQILETIQCGIALHGTEVKSCRMRSVSLHDAFAKVEKNQVFLYNMNVSPYSHGNIFNHKPIRPRILLLRKKEILRLSQKVQEKGLALIPLKMYLSRGWIKVDLGVGRGKAYEDKRETLKKRQTDLELRRDYKLR